jgi:plastocyanin
MLSDGDRFYFDPIGLHVEPGETVTWTVVNDAHSVTAYGKGTTPRRIPDEATIFDSTVLTQDGVTYEYTFDIEGTYDYFCIPHRQLGMVGRLVVGEPGGPATESQPPNGSLPPSDEIVEQGAVSQASFTE